MTFPAPIVDQENLERASVTVRGVPQFVRAALFAIVFLGASLAVSVVVSALTPAPANALIEGVDVSNWQGNINWPAVPSDRFRFAFIKASEGTTYTDPYFQRNWNGAGAAGLFRGAYHFARPAGTTTAEINADAQAEAYWFVSRVAGVDGMGGLKDLPAVLDLEYPGDWVSGVSPPGYRCWYMTPSQLSQWARTWLSTVHSLTGKVPILYTNSDYWNNCDGAPADIAANFRLWLASWGVSNPSIPRPWATWTFWQDGGADVPGIGSGIDHNYFCCDVRSLEALAGGAGGSPFGVLDSVSVLDPTRASVTGWAIDPDTRDPITVHVYVDGQGYAVNANETFPGLAEAYPGFGGAHGYSTVVPVPLGARQVCAYGINVASGVNSFLGCKSLGGDPYGVVDTVRAVGPGQLEVSGWAIDPNGVNPTQIRVNVDGVDTGILADQNRPDLGNPGGLGSLHGYATIIQLPTGGTRRVCITAVNSIGPGGPAALGCRNVTLPGGSPIGFVDSAVGGLGSISVSGWVVDPDTAASLDVHVYVDGVGTALRANQTRNDVAAGFPGYGPARGYSGTVTARGGARTICVYGINIGVGANSLLGCRVVQVPGGAPFGVLDSVTYEDGSIRAAGWAVDPDTAASVPIHVYVQGQGYALPANGARPDVALLFPAYGVAHGFSGLVPAPEGNQTVCAYAIDVLGGDGNRLLGCRTVTVPMGSPVGFIDGAVVVNGRVSLSGWAIDPNTAAADLVHVYVNGVGFEVVANVNRPDLGNPWGLGSAHGWAFSTPRVGNGIQRVCVYALNIAGPGSHQLLGCRDLS